MTSTMISIPSATSSTYMLSTTMSTVSSPMTLSTTEPLSPIIIVVPTVAILATLTIVFGVILIPIIIINNKIKRTLKVTHKEDRFSKQLSTAADLINGADSAINTDCPTSQTTNAEIETSGNHFYDKLMNYNRNEGDNATQCNHQLNSVSNDQELSPETDGVVEVTEQPTTLMKAGDQSENHMYAVLEGPVPPVPERTYKMKALDLNGLAISRENGDNEELSQHKIGRPAHMLIDVTTNAVNDHKDTCDGAGQTESLAVNPNNHTYSVLEGPLLPPRGQKVQSVAVRIVKSPNVSRVRRHSDEQHAYDTLALDTDNKSKLSSYTPTPTGSSAAENTSNDHHYAVLEGPTLIEHSHHHVMSEIREDRAPQPINLADMNIYDKLTPKVTRTTDENETSVSLDTDSHNTTTLCAKNVSLGEEVEKSGNQPGIGHTYDKLNPKEKSTKANKRKTSVRKKLKRSWKKKTSNNKEAEDSSHFYDVLVFKNEIGSEQQEWEVKSPTDVVANPSIGSPKISCEINTSDKRKITRSRTLCDVTEVCTKSVTIHTAVSDTHIHTIDPDPEAHIYDTIEVLPVSKRKGKRSGKRYRWLSLKQQLKRQEIMGCSLDQDLTIPPTSSHVTGAISSSSASISSSHVQEPNDPCSETNNYAVLDITQTYAQVGPFVPGKRGNENHEPAKEENSDYAHLQHH